MPMLFLRLPRKEAGFSISADDITNAKSELSEEELEGVAGGIIGSLITVLGHCNCYGEGTGHNRCLSKY